MIIVTGSAQARPDHLDEVLALGLEHVHRARAEAGCLLHTVHQDVEDPSRVVTGDPTLEIYDATPTSV